MDETWFFMLASKPLALHMRGRKQSFKVKQHYNLGITLIVGLDLAGVQTRPTGFCLLKDMKAETCLVYSDKEIIQKTLSCQPQVIAIDAPLCLPPGRKTLEERTANHLRDSDRELLKRGIKFFPITLGPMRKLTTRGIALKETFQTHGYTVLEAYPGGAQDVLGIPRKQRGLDKLSAGLTELGIEGLSSQLSDHELDAATCAYVGKLFLEGKAVVYGDPKEGIVMPKEKNSGEKAVI
jgi:predicted nuclease with RNAse H fold